MIRVAVVVAVVAAACGTGDAHVDAPPLVTATSTSTSTSTDPPATASTADAKALPPVTIEQVDCPAALRHEIVACGSAEVPLDRGDPGAGTTVITVATVAGYDQGFDTPAAVLQGGPGGASSELAGWFPQQAFTQVFVDQRGTGFLGSELNCVELDESTLPLLEVGSAAAGAGVDEALAACAARLAGDPALQTADSASHAADVADVMAALGYGRWIAYGVSYGSTIGLELLRTEPDGLVGVVLDGVYPPELDVDAGMAFSAANAIEELGAACLVDIVCNSWTDDVASLLDELVLALDDEPLLVDVRGRDLGVDDDVTIVLDGHRLAEFTFLLMYSESRMRFVPGALAGLAEGDAGAAEWFARTGARTRLSSVQSNDEGTYYAVQCRDRLPFTDGVPDGVRPFPAAVTTELLSDACDPWARPPAPSTAAEPVISDLPALLLSGRFDPITPPAYAEDVAARLPAATVVEQDGRGHGIWFGDECIASIVQAFVADPARDLDTSCAEVSIEIDWARP